MAGATGKVLKMDRFMTYTKIKQIPVKDFISEWGNWQDIACGSEEELHIS